MYKWKVVPLCESQLLDIKAEDVLPGGVFRTCDVYKSGGGYDKFPSICEKVLGIRTNPKQFVVQLYGCHLACPYCYVTPDGVWGEYVEHTTVELLHNFSKTNCDVFHLMGGSPALYLEYWVEIVDRINKINNSCVFHSDLLLTEKEYNFIDLFRSSGPNCLYAVNIKGTDLVNYKKNTNKKLNVNLFWSNFELVVNSGINFYLTFTNPNKQSYPEFVNTVKEKYGNDVMNNSFIIDLIDYDAVKAYRGGK